MKKPLSLFSKNPPTGFRRNGYCDVPPEDTGNHSVAGTFPLSFSIPSHKKTNGKQKATLTDPFLDFTASRGNNLRSIGLTEGQKWCLCASRWKEAMEAAQNEQGQSVVPKVHLHATHERALDAVSMEDLKKYAAEPEVGNASTVPQSRNGNSMPGGVPTKERTELANREEMTSKV
ncbi:hypothetical protein ACMFMG_010804 [Clarireedia jacksonii]